MLFRVLVLPRLVVNLGWGGLVAPPPFFKILGKKMKKNFGQDIASVMNNTLFKTASAGEDASKMHSHDSNCADDCESTMKDEEMSASDEVELALDNKEAAFQMAVDSLLSASAFLESMAEVRKSDFILKVAAKLVKHPVSLTYSGAPIGYCMLVSY